MRIGFFAWETLNTLEVGGVAVVVTKLAEALAKKGHEVHVFTRMGGYQKEHEEINGVHEHRCISPESDDFIEYMDHLGDSMVSCFHYVEGTYGKFDILHGHDWHIVNALCNLKHNKGYDFVWSCHSTEWGRNGGSSSDSWWSRRISHREWLGGMESKAVTTVSWTMRQEISGQYQTPSDKIWVIYNGIEPDEFAGEVDSGRIKESHGVHPLAPVVLFIGRMCHQKGPDLLLEAVPHVLARRWDTHFVFAGGGQGMIDHIKGRANYLGVGGNVHVLGYVSDHVMGEWLKACDLVCIPSRNEPFGIVCLEAWSAGKPVVITDVGGMSEIVENFRTGIKVSHWPPSIAWGINYILGDDGTFVKTMSKNVRKRVQDFSWDKIADQYLEVYSKFIEKKDKKGD
ncbi:glycosyltransferase family 4 protein [Candidatus Altiarchaeota archaeon]